MGDDKSEILTQYNQIANTFTEAVVDNNKDSNSDFFSYFNNSLGGKFILDLGCGSGYDLKQMQIRGARIFGLDASEEMVRISQEVNPKGIIKQGFFEKIPFSSNYFDFVISKWAFQTAFHIDPIYEEVYRVLKKDGQFIFLTGHPTRQFIEKKKNNKDYFNKEMVESVFFDGKIKVTEPSHTINEYLSPTFFKRFSLFSFHEGNDSSAERVNGDIYPSYFIISAGKK